MNKTFAGIGSRETPREICTLMSEIGLILATKGYILHSGGAEGADLAFEAGCDLGKGDKKIWIPWPGFNGSSSLLDSVCPEAYRVAKIYHPAWDRLGQGGKALMARNGYQVLSETLDTPVDFVVCWTKDGTATGGTGQALRIAEDYDVPVYNLFYEENRNLSWLKNL